MNITSPDNFRNNWYGWVTNQWAHVLLGQILFGMIMIISLQFGEFANRVIVWGGMSIAYVVWELATHNHGSWWDAIEDFIFVCGYGAGWVAFAFHEVSIGLPIFSGNALTVIPIIGLFAFHSTLGVFLRIYGKANE